MGLHAKYEVSNGSKVMVKIKVFIYVGQRSLGQNFGRDRKTLVTRNIHVKYESSTSNGSKVMAKVKVLKNVGQRSRSSTLSFEKVPYAKCACLI